MAKKKPTKKMPTTKRDPHKGVQINLRLIDERMLEALEEYATRQRRTRNYALNLLLEDALSRAGLWPPPEDEPA